MGTKDRDFVFKALEINNKARERAVRPDEGDIFVGGGGATGRVLNRGGGSTAVFVTMIVFGGSGVDLGGEINRGLSRGAALLWGRSWGAVGRGMA